MTPSTHGKNHHKNPDPKTASKTEAAPRPDPLQVAEPQPEVDQSGESIAERHPNPKALIGTASSPGSAPVSSEDRKPEVTPELVGAPSPRPRKEASEKSRPFTIMLSPAQYRRLARLAAIEETTISALLGELTEKEDFKARLRGALNQAVRDNESDDLRTWVASHCPAPSRSKPTSTSSGFYTGQMWLTLTSRLTSAPSRLPSWRAWD